MALNWQELQDGMEAGLKDLLNQLIDGTIADLDGPVRDIASRMAFAAKRGRPELVAECRDQLCLLVLEKELRIRGDSMDWLEGALNIGLGALLNGAIGGLNTIRPR